MKIIFFRPKLSLPKPVPAAIGNQMIDRQTNIQTDRQIYRQLERYMYIIHIHRYADRQKDIQIRQKDICTDRKRYRQKDIQTERYADRKKYTQKDIQSERYKERQI